MQYMWHQQNKIKSDEFYHILHFQKNITETGNKISDKYIEYNIGYRISDNMKVGVSRIGAKENNIEYRSFYTMFSYFKEF